MGYWTCLFFDNGQCKIAICRDEWSMRHQILRTPTHRKLPLINPPLKTMIFIQISKHHLQSLIWISGRGDADSEEITEKMMRAWEVNVHMVREPPILCQHRLNSDAKTKSMTNKPEVWRLISASMGGWGVINTFQGPVNDKGFAMEFRRSSTPINYHKTSVF